MGVKISVAIESAEFGHTYDDFVSGNYFVIKSFHID